MTRLDGQVAFVTGGASGIGRAVVERFVAEGAQVGVLQPPSPAADRLASGDHVLVVEGDVRSAAEQRAAVAATVAEFGALDVAVANGGSR